MRKIEIGKEAEQIALQYERCQASGSDRTVRLVSDNPCLGYDIEVLERGPAGSSIKVIEVKTWNRNGYFIITENEVESLSRFGAAAWIYLVDINSERVVKTIQNPFLFQCKLKPINFKYFY